MSGRAFLGLTISAVGVVIYTVHAQQVWDKNEMRKGVERDIARLSIRRQQKQEQNERK
jgi:hypothetical protein